MKYIVSSIALVISLSLSSVSLPRVIALLELSSHDESSLLRLERDYKRSLHGYGLNYKPTKQKKHITLAVLNKFHETLRDLKKNNPEVIRALSVWAGKRNPILITPMLSGARVEAWVPPYFKNQQHQKYPDYYNIVITFPPYTPLESFTKGLDTELKKVPGYRYNRRGSFVPHVTLGKLYPRGKKFSDGEIASLRKIIGSMHPLYCASRSTVPVSCLMIKESNTHKIYIPLGRR